MAGPDFVWGNMAWNAMIVGALGYMIKRWMDDTKTKIDRHCTENKAEHAKIDSENKAEHAKIDSENKAEHGKLFGKWEDHDRRITRVETHLELEGERIGK